MTSENLKNAKTFSYLNNFKFLGVICNEYWLKFKLIWNKSFFLKGNLSQKKQEWGKNVAPPNPRVR